MSDVHRSRLALRLTLTKVLRSRINLVVFAALPALVAWLWTKESFEMAFKFFLFLFPYVFLFLSQDAVKEELRSGALENVLFVGGEHKSYLWRKSCVLDGVGLGYSLVLFCLLSCYSCWTHRFQALDLGRFLVGILVGVYYERLGGLLSYYLRGGSNVLILIIVQGLAFAAIASSVAHRSRFIDFLDKGIFPDLVSQLKFLALVALLPNIVIWKRFWPYALEILVLLVGLFGVQKIKIDRLELKRQ